MVGSVVDCGVLGLLLLMSVVVAAALTDCAVLWCVRGVRASGPPPVLCDCALVRDACASCLWSVCWRCVASVFAEGEEGGCAVEGWADAEGRARL